MVGREAITAAKASAFSFEPIRICSGFQAVNISSRSLTRHTYFVTPLTRYPVSSEGVNFFFPVYYELIIFKLVHSYNVKHLTCIILCSSELQNIYKLYIWKCSTFTIFTLLTKEKKIHIH